MIVKINSDFVNVNFYNEDLVKILLLDVNIVQDFLNHINGSIDVKNDFYLKYSDDAASMLLEFSRVFTKGHNMFLMQQYVSNSDLRLIGTVLTKYYTHTGEGKKKQEVKRYLGKLNYVVLNSSLVFDTADSIIRKLNSCGVKTLVYSSKSTNSIYIKPDCGVVRTIRVSDHSKNDLEFTPYYVVICNGYSGFHEVSTDTYRLLRTDRANKNRCTDRLYTLVAREIGKKKSKLGNASYNRMVYGNEVSSNNSNSSFKLVRTLREYIYS